MPHIEFEEPDLSAPDSGAAEAPEITDAPDPASDTAAAPSEEAPSDGQPRDDQGRFAPKSGEGEEPQTPAEGAPPAPSDAAASAPPAPADTPPESTPPASASEPWSIRVHGRSLAIEGAAFDPAARRLTVEGDGLTRLQQLAARGVEYETVGRRQMQELQAQLEERNLKADALAALAELPEEDLYEAILRFKQDLPVLTARQEAEQLRRQLAQQQRGTPADPAHQQEQQRAAFVEDVRATATEHFTAIMAAEKGLADEDVKDIRETLLATPGRYVRRATEADVLTYGGEVGEPVFDTDMLARDVSRLTGIARRNSAAAVRAAEAQKQNAARLAASTNAPPVATTATATPVRGAAPAPAKTFEEWKQRNGV